jgi:UDP-glucose 4-epimerase
MARPDAATRPIRPRLLDPRRAGRPPVKAVVTGGGGFIGSHLVERLVRDGHRVVVVDNFLTGRTEHLAAVASAVDVRRGDIRDAGALDRACVGAEVVYHLAALTSVAGSVEAPIEVADVNVTGTVHVLRAAATAGARRVVFASSSSVYGDTPTLPKREEMEAVPRSPYAASKLAAESFLWAFQACHDLEVAALRFFNVYGPRQSPFARYAAAVPRFVTAMLAGRPPVIHGDGLQTRDFTYVTDVADAVVKAATSPRAVEGPINIGGGIQVPIVDLAASVARAVGFRGRPVHEAARAGDVRDSVADLSRARERLGWLPMTSLDDGVARMTAWAKSPEGDALLRRTETAGSETAS